LKKTFAIAYLNFFDGSKLKVVERNEVEKLKRKVEVFEKESELIEFELNLWKLRFEELELKPHL